MWEARKFDRRVTEEVEESYKTSGRWNKSLINREALSTIATIISRARVYHYKNTVPWAGEDALIPVEKLEEYNRKMEGFKTQLAIAVEEFYYGYPQYIAEARENDETFNQNHYPPQDRIRNKFAINITYLPVPITGDIRVDLPDGMRQEVERRLQAEQARLQKEINVNLWNRIYTTVHRMAERLSTTDRVFRDSLMGNVTDLCNMLYSLNVNQDPNLEAMRKKLEEKLASTDPGTLRDDPATRQTVADNARKILEEIDKAGHRALEI